MLECPRESESLINWIMDNVITLYTMSENRNDFFLLHGITSSWALSQILTAIKSEETKLEILQTYLCVILSVYISKDRANLNPEYLGSSEEPEMSWDDLMAKVLSMPITTEEHRYKLVHVCYESFLRNPEKSALYMKAAFTTLGFHFHIGSMSESKKWTE